MSSNLELNFLNLYYAGFLHNFTAQISLFIYVSCMSVVRMRLSGSVQFIILKRLVLFNEPLSSICFANHNFLT